MSQAYRGGAEDPVTVSGEDSRDATADAASLLASDQPGSRVPWLRLDGSLEEIADAWQVLRAVWDDIESGGIVSVRYGVGRGWRLSDASVESLARLAGFSPQVRRQVGGGTELQARRVERDSRPLSCSVIVPCRNEAGNVEELVRRVPAMGTHTELVFVDGGSSDGTPELIERAIRAHPERDIILLHQRGGGGKAAAVFQGFDVARGDVLMILDADMTVAPEDLPRFFCALAENVADVANGNRFAFPMQAGAMKPLNHAGNRAFGHFFSWLLGASVSDTLCGTKALFRADWPAIARARPLFGQHDPWGDFDLLLGAAYAGLRLIEVPVAYRARVAGESKMRPIRHGAALGRTCLAGVRHLKLEHRQAVGQGR